MALVCFRGPAHPVFAHGLTTWIKPLRMQFKPCKNIRFNSIVINKSRLNVFLVANRVPFRTFTVLKDITPMEHYLQLVKDNQLHTDVRQQRTMAALQNLHDQLRDYHPHAHSTTQTSLYSSFFGGSKHGSLLNAPKGLYIWGGVGVGKTMLMDLFFKHTKSTKKRRARIHEWRRHHSGDPIPVVAKAIAQETLILCFDEFQVTDVADALILRRLFGMLFDHGCVVVATSNRAPDDLYEGGLNRPLFLPFIDLLKNKCQVIGLEDTGVDYRMLSKQDYQVYHYPLNEQTSANIQMLFQKMSGSMTATSRDIPVSGGGRWLHVPKQHTGVCQFTFHDLCGQPLGAADYIAITQHYHSVIITDVPIMTARYHNQARRFITLIDILYENNVGMACSAAAPLESIFQLEEGGLEENHTYEWKQEYADLNAQPQTVKKVGVSMSELSGTKDTGFAYVRAISRIVEMQGEEYWSRHKKHQMEAQESK